jgi:hypothetical protein
MPNVSCVFGFSIPGGTFGLFRTFIYIIFLTQVRTGLAQTKQKVQN